MPINIFEGARRVIKAVMAIAAAGSIVAIWSSSPHVTMHYYITGPGSSPTLGGECRADDATEYINRESANGRRMSILLCFRAYRGSRAGEMLIPYKLTEDGKWWMNEKYSRDVNAYTKSVANAFTFPPDDAKQADKLWDKARRKDLFEGLGTVIISIIVFLIFTKVVGWIVRGFLGIPSGQDVRPQ